MRVGNTNNLRHGHTRGGRISPEYKAWESMNQRCSNPNNRSWKHYGGRGIRVCERWRGSFKAFLLDVGARPSEQHSLDRFPNMNGNYEPGNVRWATREQQGSNKRANHRVTAFGRTLTLSEWSRESGIGADTISRRLCVWNWAPEEAVSKPTPEIPRSIDWFRQLVEAAGFSSVSAFLREKNISPASFYKLTNRAKPIREKTVQKIADALCLEPKLLLQMRNRA
jgi:hypothetical protein